VAGVFTNCFFGILRGAVLLALLVAAVAEQAPLVDLSIQKPDIEEIVRRLDTGEALPDP
jgi:hypothetical protein